MLIFTSVTVHAVCDSLTRLSLSQTSLLRALPSFVPVLLFPAMNTHMFTHPLTAKQLQSVQDDLGYEVLGPIAKTLACGDIGECRDLILWFRECSLY